MREGVAGRGGGGGNGRAVGKTCGETGGEASRGDAMVVGSRRARIWSAGRGVRHMGNNQNPCNSTWGPTRISRARWPSMVWCLHTMLHTIPTAAHTHQAPAPLAHLRIEFIQ